MAFLLFILFFYAPEILESAQSPLDSSNNRSNPIDCEYLSLEGARKRAPGEIAKDGPRGDFVDRQALECRERLLGKRYRDPRDDSILMSLTSSSRETASLVSQLPPAQRGRMWMVEAYYPSDRVSYKLRFAVANELLERGLQVTDRKPTLALGDIEALTRSKGAEIYPQACKRYQASQSMGPGDALVGVVLRDMRATALHTGICMDGVWRWLR